jgi:hypothetical protein
LPESWSEVPARVTNSDRSSGWEGCCAKSVGIAVAEKMANMMNTFDSFMGSGSSGDDLLG